MALTEAQRNRYQRQIIMEEVGEEGQMRLAAGRVLVVGAGGLGSAAAFYLAAAGVGTLGIIDDGEVELSNLQRQILHTTGRVGMPKAASAGLTLKALNPEIKINTYHLRLDKANAADLIGPYDIVVGALDNFETRYLVNETCVMLGKPLVEGGVRGFNGLLMTVLPGRGPCYCCVFPPAAPAGSQAPVSEEPIPVFATSPGVIGTLQAHEALKLLLKVGTPLVGRILFYDGLTGSFYEQEVKQAPNCPCCGDPTPT